MGFAFYVSPEMEFFYFEKPEVPLKGLDEGGYFDQTSLDVASDLRRDTVLTLEKMGIEVASSHHEDAPSPARDRFALYRCADDGGQCDDLPFGGERDCRETRRLGDVYAQASFWRQWQWYAYEYVAVQGRGQCVLRC